MIRSLFMLLLSGLSCLLFSSAVSVTTPPPDPETFSKLFVETIKKNDKELYMKTFGFAEADVQWMINACLTSSYLTEKQKDNMREKAKDLSWFWTEQNERLAKSFDRIQAWINSDSIQVDSIERVDLSYTLGIRKEAPIYILYEENLIIKHGTKFYKIYFDAAAFINSQWKIGEVRTIVKVDISQSVSFDIGAPFSFDIGSDEITYDTVSAVVAVDTTLYPADSVAHYGWHTELPPLTEKQSKKADKIQKKIDALYEQQEKIIYTK